MSVVVKGMSMPSECEYCGFCRYYPENGNVWCNANNRILKLAWKEPNWTHLDVRRPDWCPLEEIETPHGRLIDAGKLSDKMRGKWTVYDYEALGTMPTIIEAEGVDE